MSAPTLIPDRAAVFRYLFELQDSGATNMLGADSYLVKKFGMSAATADDFVGEYIDNYDALRAKYGPEAEAEHLDTMVGGSGPAGWSPELEAPEPAVAPAKLSAVARATKKAEQEAARAAKKAEREAKKAAAAAAPKKPRGRPRKEPAATGSNAAGPGGPVLEEPAAAAGAAATRKPRGRPRKTPKLETLLAELTEVRAQLSSIQAAYSATQAKLDAVKTLLTA